MRVRIISRRANFPGAGSGTPTVMQVADQIRPKVPKLAGLMDSGEEDVLAYMAFPTLG